MEPRGGEVRSPPEPPHFDLHGRAPVEVEELAPLRAEEHGRGHPACRALRDGKIEHEALDAADLRAPEVVDDPHGRRRLEARGGLALLPLLRLALLAVAVAVPAVA